jgi:hypothetical protein
MMEEFSNARSARQVSRRSMIGRGMRSLGTFYLKAGVVVPKVAFM